MCKCTPEIKTPWCGKPGCETPEQKKEMMTDQAISDLMAGKTVAVKDKKGVEYLPVWSVRFVKV